MAEEFLPIFIAESREELSQAMAIALKKKASKEDITTLLRLFHTLKGNSRLINLDGLSTLAHKLEEDTKEISAAPKGVGLGVLIGGIREFEARLDKLEEPDKPEPQPPVRLEAIRVPVESLNKVLRATGELKAKLSSLKTLDSGDPQFKRSLYKANRILIELEATVLDQRMFPLGTVLERFPASAIELAAQLGKEVDVEIECSDIKLDNPIIEAIHEPMVHLLRNAVDHGIELPKERRALGKPKRGKISIKAQRLKDQVLVEIRDDGAGINADEVAKKAEALGFISKVEKERLSYHEKLNLLFRTGFTTQAKPTEISGRGIGLDIVWDSLRRIGGSVRITTEVSKGTAIELRLPLTFSLVDVLFLKIGTLELGLPLLRVSKVLPYSHKKQYRYPIVFLAEVMGEPIAFPKKLIMYEFQNELVGLAVDDVLYRDKVLIEQPDKRLRSLKGIAGSTLFGDGQVCLMLDADSLNR
jgi:two-component system, chemotaxis family, sensor kinase CheA